MTTTEMRNYTRWRADTDGTLHADIIASWAAVTANPVTGRIELTIGPHRASGTPDEARLIGVRLIEAAALADGDRAIREAP